MYIYLYLIFQQEFCSVFFLLYQENYTFTVGYHELSGSKVPLKKPLLVLKKTTPLSDADHIINSSNVQLQVIGIIRHRILFKTRPKALISSKFFSQLLNLSNIGGYY